jgi:putative PIN family toxin of toxin-antitoxin system
VPRVVLDTNVFLDCWVFEDAAARPLRAALEMGRVLPVRSAATDAELVDVIARPQFAARAAAGKTLLDWWQRQARLIEVNAVAPVRCSDPADQRFLDLAFAAQAHVLVTKDKALLATAPTARRHHLFVVPPDRAESVLLVEDRLA